MSANEKCSSQTRAGTIFRSLAYRRFWTGRLWRALPALLMAAALLLPLGQPAAQRAMTQEEIDRLLAKADQYLNTLDRVRGRFLQVSSDGATAEGVFFVNRPGKMRFEYDPPVPILMIADNSTFLYYDEELEEATLIPLWSTPLWFLLEEETRLNERVVVKHITQTERETTYTLIDPEGTQSGELDLVFSNDPFELKQWIVRDAHGVTTEVTLIGLQHGVEIGDELFEWRHLPGANMLDQNRDQDR